MAVCNFEAVSSLWDGRAYKQSHRCREGKTFPLLCFPETGAPPVTAQASSNCSAQRTVPTETLSSGSCGWNQEINRLCSAQEITFLLYLRAHSLSFGKHLLWHDRQGGIYDNIQPWLWWMRLLSKRGFTGPTTASFFPLLPAKSYTQWQLCKTYFHSFSFHRAPLHHILPGGNMSLCQLVATSGSSPSLVRK